MAKHTHTLQFNFTGGIISPGKLLELLELLDEATVTHVRFGLRQQLLLDVPDKSLANFIASCNARQIRFSDTPNILSSYPAADIFTSNTWLTEGVYKDVFNQLDYQPALKVNICDSRQTFVPLFTGHINWITSGSLHYWYLYLRPPGSQELFPWPELVYTNDIATVSRKAELLLLQGVSPDIAYQDIKNTSTYISKEKDKEPDFLPFHLPYYEGFNKHHNSYWLGIYKRDEEFSTAFLKEICILCMETRIGQLYATPWKSLVIRNIDTAHRRLWDFILGKHGINVRHAANELNWQVEDNCEDGLILKRHIIRYFDIADVRTYGLCFSVRVFRPASLFGNIVIRKRENPQGSRLKYMQRYDILYTADFNANTGALIPYRENVSKEHLGPYVSSLCRLFYEQSSKTDTLMNFVNEQRTLAQPDHKEYILHQCTNCYTVYDPVAGDPAHAVQPGTPFSEVPATYTCSVCDAGRDDFKEIKNTDLLFRG